MKYRDLFEWLKATYGKDVAEEAETLVKLDDPDYENYSREHLSDLLSDGFNWGQQYKDLKVVYEYKDWNEVYEELLRLEGRY